MDAVNKVVIFDNYLAFVSALPKVADFFISPIKMGGIGPRECLHELREIQVLLWLADKMDVVRHQAETVNLEVKFFLVLT
jgi:hypothetical protein